MCWKARLLPIKSVGRTCQIHWTQGWKGTTSHRKEKVQRTIHRGRLGFWALVSLIEFKPGQNVNKIPFIQTEATWRGASGCRGETSGPGPSLLGLSQPQIPSGRGCTLICSEQLFISIPSWRDSSFLSLGEIMAACDGTLVCQSHCLSVPAYSEGFLQ